MEAFVHKVNVIKCCRVFTFYSLPLFLKFFFFSCGPFLKSLLNLLQYCFCFMFWFFGCDWPRGVQNLSSPTRDWTHTPCIGRQSLNHWTVREIPYSLPFLSRTKIFHVTMKPWISVAVCPSGGLLITFFLKFMVLLFLASHFLVFYFRSPPHPLFWFDRSFRVLRYQTTKLLWI